MPLSVAHRITDKENAHVFLSDLLGRKVVDDQDRALGRVDDALIDVSSEPASPPVRAFFVRSSRKSRRRLEWPSVVAVSPDAIRVSGEGALVPERRQPNEILLASEVLDRQIVDMDGAKVERVNDLHLIWIRGSLRLAHVDVGLRGLVRRMGWQGIVDRVVGRLRPGAVYLRHEGFVPWRHVQPLNASPSRLQLDVARKSLKLHPADLAEIVQDLDRPEREVFFRGLPTEAAADTLEEADSELQQQLIKLVEPERAADLIEAMEPDDAADLLAELPKEQSDQLLAAMDAQEARAVQRLLAYDPKEAGGMMTPDFISLSLERTANQALDDIRLQARSIPHVEAAFVVGADKGLLGFIPLRELLVADPGKPLRELLREHPAPLKPNDSAKRVAELAAKYNLLSLPVQDDSGRLLGVVTVDDVLEQVLHG